VEELDRDVEMILTRRIRRWAPLWLHHCETIKKSMDLGDAQLVLVNKRCMVPSLAAASYVKPAKKSDQREAGRAFHAVACHTVG